MTVYRTIDEAAAEAPITLAHACELMFAGTVTPRTLRAEAARGRLDIFRIGKRDYTTLASLRGMVEQCRVARPARGSISTKSAVRGLSETEQLSFARARANLTVERLKKLSPATSPASTARRRAPIR